MGITISVLDQSPVYPGKRRGGVRAHGAACPKSEELGFRRFWVSEHHDSDQVAGSSPEVLISYLLAKTRTIRVGSGGVMSQRLQSLQGSGEFQRAGRARAGRVDLGIGRAPGGLPRAAAAGGVQEDASLTDKIVELRKFVHNTLEEDHPLAGLRAAPSLETAPELYVLGQARARGNSRRTRSALCPSSSTGRNPRRWRPFAFTETHLTMPMAGTGNSCRSVRNCGRYGGGSGGAGRGAETGEDSFGQRPDADAGDEGTGGRIRTPGRRTVYDRGAGTVHHQRDEGDRA